MNHGHDMPLHDQAAALACEVSDLIIDLARVSGRLSEVHHRLWHLCQDTDPEGVEDALDHFNHHEKGTEE